MKRRRSRFLRTRREWVIRVLLATFVMFLGYGMIAKTLAMVVMVTAPEAAHRIDPSNGQIAGLVAQHMVAAGASEATRRTIRALSARALMQDPTAVSALVAMGSDAQMRGDINAARRFFYLLADSVASRSAHPTLFS